MNPHILRHSWILAELTASSLYSIASTTQKIMYTQWWATQEIRFKTKKNFSTLLKVKIPIYLQTQNTRNPRIKLIEIRNSCGLLNEIRNGIKTKENSYMMLLVVVMIAALSRILIVYWVLDDLGFYFRRLWRILAYFFRRIFTSVKK